MTTTRRDENIKSNDRRKKRQINRVKEEVRNNDGSSFLLHGGAFSRLIVFSDPHPLIPGQMDYIV